MYVSGNLRPLLAGREACAASAAQTGVGNFGDYLVGGHVKQRLFKGGVAADGNVLLNAFRVYVSAVLKSNAGLLLIEGDILLTNIALAVLMVNKAVDDLIVENGLFYYLLAVVNRDLYVQKPHRLYAHERTHLAEAVAAAVLEADRFVVRFVLQNDIDLQSALLHELLHSVVNVQRAAGDTAGAAADDDLLILAFESLFELLAALDKLLSAFNPHEFSASFNSCTSA